MRARKVAFRVGFSVLPLRLVGGRLKAGPATWTLLAIPTSETISLGTLRLAQ